MGVSTSARDINERNASIASACSKSAPVTGDHDRIEHHILRAIPIQPAATTAITPALLSIPIFTAPAIEIGEHGIHLRADEIGRHVVNRGDPFGILRRERGDDRGAIDAERGEVFRSACIPAPPPESEPAMSRRWASSRASLRQHRIDDLAQGARRGGRIGRERQRRDDGDAVGAGGDDFGGVRRIDAGDATDRQFCRATPQYADDPRQAFGADRRFFCSFDKVT